MPWAFKLENLRNGGWAIAREFVPQAPEILPISNFKHVLGHPYFILWMTTFSANKNCIGERWIVRKCQTPRLAGGD